MNEAEQGRVLVTTPRAAIAAKLHKQAGWCRRLGSPLYAYLLEQAAADVEAGGACWEALRGHDVDPHGSALALRFMGAVHRIVLTGESPELARYYPSTNGHIDNAKCWPLFRATVERHRDALRELVNRPVQTNEVGRAAALVGGFLLVSQESKLPLRLLEIGASAGLNLRWDHYYYEAESASFGDQASTVRLTGVFTGGHPPLATQVRISERRGCDLNPLDLETEEGELTLLSFVWADQTARLKMLRGAIEVARKVVATVDAADAPQWLEAQLMNVVRDTATVVFHSIMWQYMSEEGRRRVVEALEQAGALATSNSPLAWLRMEPGNDEAEVRLKTWPNGQERLIATAGFHGQNVRWLLG
ncbi:MAG TPA: DUF2332 domain-containing protein [Pyrinomonadaceae bacterium]